MEIQSQHTSTFRDKKGGGGTVFLKREMAKYRIEAKDERSNGF